MKQILPKKVLALMLVLSMLASLGACAWNPKEILDKIDLSQLGSNRIKIDKKAEQAHSAEDTAPTPSTEMEPSQADSTRSEQSEKPEQIHPEQTENTTSNKYTGAVQLINPPPNTRTEEAEQHLMWLRQRMNVPYLTFGVAYLGYVGGLFEQGFESGFPQWLQKTNEAMLEKYPFIAQIDSNHIIGGAGHLYCIVPVDEKATVSVSRVDENENSETIYQSEIGDPVLLFANLDDIPSQADTQVIVTDSSGNSCKWNPTLDAQNRIVPNIEADGNYTPFDFTEYGWQDTPSYLAPWLADDWEGMKAAALADNGWQTKTTVRESDRNAYFALWFYPGDETGGTVDLYWMYEDSDGFEEFWNGTWEIESVMEGPSYITFDLSLEWGKGDIDPANPQRIQETYPALISPSGNLLIGMGENGVCLPFMSQNTNTYILTWME